MGAIPIPDGSHSTTLAPLGEGSRRERLWASPGTSSDLRGVAEYSKILGILSPLPGKDFREKTDRYVPASTSKGRPYVAVEHHLQGSGEEKPQASCASATKACSVGLSRRRQSSCSLSCLPPGGNCKYSHCEHCNARRWAEKECKYKTTWASNTER